MQPQLVKQRSLSVVSRTNAGTQWTPQKLNSIARWLRTAGWLLPLILLVWMLAGCATNSPPLPLVAVKPARIPSPPVRIEPRHSQPALPAALNYSTKVDAFLSALPGSETTSQPK